MDKKINLKTLRVQMLEKETDQFQETMAYFDYMGKQVNKPVYVSKQKSANQKYYIEETKKIIAKENESGELFKYARWYLNGGHNRNKLVLGICAGLVAAAGLGVGGYFIGKTLTGGSVKVTFNANPDELHVACFDDDINKTSLTFDVAKGSKFGDIKKMANPVRHEPVDGKASINGKVYDTLKQWELGGELVNDDFKINKDITFDATYKRDTVTVTILAAGNGSGFIPTGSEQPDDQLTSYVRKIEYANVEKGTTLDKVLRIGGTEQEPEYFEPGMMDAECKVMEDSGFRCFYDHTKGREVYENEDTKDYETYIIEEDTVLEAYYESSGTYVDSLNVSLCANWPSIEGSDSAISVGEFCLSASGEETESYNSITVGVIIPGEVNLSWNTLLSNMTDYYIPNVNDPIGKYASFDHWVLSDGTPLVGEICDEERFSRDFSVYAYYKPDFENDTWAMINANAELGVTRLAKLYGNGDINNLYGLKRHVEMENENSQDVYVVGVGADATESATTWKSSGEEYEFRILKNRTALTFQFSGSVANMPYATSSSGTDYVGCAVANYLGTDFENLIADSELKRIVVPVLKADNFFRWQAFYRYRFFIPSAGELMYVHGGYPDGTPKPDYGLYENSWGGTERLQYKYTTSTFEPRENAWVRGATNADNIMYLSSKSSAQPILAKEEDPISNKHDVYPMFTIGTYGTI